MIKKRNQIKNKARKSTNLTDFVNYKKQRAKTKNHLNYCRRDSWNVFMQTVTANTAITIVWRRARNLTTRTNFSYPTIIKYDNTKAITDLERAEALLEPLDINLGEDDTAKKLNNMYPNQPDNSHDDYNSILTMKELNRAIKTLKDGATGPDLVHNAFLKNLTPNTKNILLSIYNK